MVETVRMGQEIITEKVEMINIARAKYPPFPLNKSGPDITNIINDGIKIKFEIIRNLKYFWFQMTDFGNVWLFLGLVLLFICLL